MKFNRLPKTLSEAELVRGCQKGKLAAQEALYHTYHRKMFGVCLRYAKSKEMAEDMLQEGFIKVFERIQKFRSEGSLEGWVRRIMVNTALDELRKNMRFFRVEDIESAAGLESEGDLFSGMEREAILKEIQQLSTGYRAVFNLYMIEGYNHREIAGMLNISEGTSKSQLARAKAQLRTNLRTYYEEAYGSV